MVRYEIQMNDPDVANTRLETHKNEAFVVQRSRDGKDGLVLLNREGATALVAALTEWLGRNDQAAP